MVQTLFNFSANRNTLTITLSIIALMLISILLGSVAAIVPMILIIGSPLVISMLLLLFRYPELSIALLMTGFTLYLLMFNVLGIYTSSITTSIYYLILALGGVVGAAALNRQSPFFLLTKNWTVLLTMFVLWLSINWFLFSFDNAYAQSRMALMMLLGIMPFTASLLLSKTQLERLLKWSFIFSSTTMLLTLYQLFGQGAQFSNARATAIKIERVSGTEDFNALWVAYIIAAGMTILWCFALTRKKQIPLLLAVIFSIVAILTIISTGSRGPFIAIGLVMIFLLTTLNLRYKFILLLVVGILCLYLFGGTLEPSNLVGANRIVDSITFATQNAIATFDEVDWVTAGRLSIWRYAIILWLENPWLGTGIGNFPGLYAHNIVLELLSEYGLVGFILFFGFLLSVIRAGVSIYHTNRNDFVTLSALSLLILSLGQMLFSGNLQNSVMFWIAAAFVLNLHMSNNKIRLSANYIAKNQRT